VGADDAVFETAIDGRDGGRVFLRVDLALFEDRFANAFVFVEAKGFDPGHLAASSGVVRAFYSGSFLIQIRKLGMCGGLRPGAYIGLMPSPCG
jgi:hypothetical protein